VEIRGENSLKVNLNINNERQEYKIGAVYGGTCGRKEDE
jgi:hypothetical protein